MDPLSPPGPPPPGSTSHDGDPPRAWDVGCLLVLAWSLIRVPPWLPLFLFESDGVDPSWLALLNEAATGDWHFGTDILFTYGPLGFLHGRVFDPDTYATLMAAWLLAACVLAFTLWRIAGQLGVGGLTRFLGVIVAVELLGRDVTALCFSLQAALFLTVVPVQRTARTPQPDVPSTRFHGIMDATHRLLLVLLVAALPWVKFSYLPSVAGLAVCLGIAAVMQRRLPIEAAVLLLGSLAVWFGTGHTATDLNGYLLHGLELSSGYSAAMGTGPGTLSGWIAVLTAAVISLSLPWWLATRVYDRRRDRWLAALFFSGLLFVIFKSTFVRWHPGKLASFLSPVLLLLLIGLPCRRSVAVSVGGRCCRVIFGGAVCLFAAAWITCSGPGPDRPLLNWITGPSVRQVKSLLQTARDPAWLTTTHQHQLELICQANPIPPVEGSVDAFPSKLITPLAHRLDVQPRPVIQSYAAYTPRLLEANRDHLGSVRAPRHVLLTVSAIDDRLPTMDDAGAWLALLRRYQPVVEREGTYRLDRLPAPRQWDRELVASRSLRWNEACDVESLKVSGPEGWLLCSIDCRPSASGRLATALYRLPAVTLEIVAGGQTHELRLIPACAREGFLLSPLVLTATDIPLLWKPWLCNAKSRTTQSPATTRNQLQALTLTTPLESCFDGRIELKLWRVTPCCAIGD